MLSTSICYPYTLIFLLFARTLGFINCLNLAMILPYLTFVNGLLVLFIQGIVWWYVSKTKIFDRRLEKKAILQEKIFERSYFRRVALRKIIEIRNSTNNALC